MAELTDDDVRPWLKYPHIAVVRLGFLWWMNEYDDLVSETTIIMLGALARWDVDKATCAKSTYIYTKCRQGAIDAMRRTKLVHRGTGLHLTPIPIEAADLHAQLPLTVDEDTVAGDECMHAILAACNDDDQRLAVLLRRDGASLGEIAAAFGYTESRASQMFKEIHVRYKAGVVGRPRRLVDRLPSAPRSASCGARVASAPTREDQPMER